LDSSKYININNNDKIKIIIKPIEKFYNYKYKLNWIKNHEKNIYLNDKSNWKSDWKLNMLWSEKINFVKETIENKYFDTELYGWCDIGYFRNTINDLNTSKLINWCKNLNIVKNNTNKIIYGCINNDNRYIININKLINEKNIKGLPIKEIPPTQKSIAGGFFIIHKNNIEWWFQTYDNKLKLYFENDYLVKDDQIILADCIFSNINRFILMRENIHEYDNWFMFQRILN
jgi:hypothetical protein